MKGGMISVIIIGLFIFVSLNFVCAVTNVSSCGTLNTGNVTYTMNRSINATHDCMIINATNITLDCQGYTITFGNSSGGWGILASDEGTYAGYDNVTIKNCVIAENVSADSDGGIFFGTTSKRAIVINSTILTYSSLCYGINFNDNSVNANISLNNITTFGSLSDGIYIGTGGNNSKIRNNNITTSGNVASGIVMSDSSTNATIFNNKIVTYGGTSPLLTPMAGVFLETGTVGMNVSSNNITTNGTIGVGIWIWSFNSSIEKNTITTSGEVGVGIYLSGVSGINLTSNTITTLGNSAYGIYSIMSANTSLVFYKNVITTSGNQSYGITFDQNSDNNVSSNNITTSGNQSYGMFFNQSHNHLLTGNRITTRGADSYVLYLITSANETVYNNIFNTSTTGSGVYIETSNPSYFNTTETVATNVIDKPSMGGNFWTNNASTGYSDNCIDADADYFCDFAYVLSSEGIDYLPLSNHSNMVSVCKTLNITGRTYYLNHSLTGVNGTCINLAANGVTFNLSNYWIIGNSTGYGINITGYNYSNIIGGVISNFSSGIYINSSSNNAFTNVYIQKSRRDAILLEGANSDNNNFTGLIVTSTNASCYDINLSTEGIDGTRFTDSLLVSYAFTGAGGIINLEESNFGKVAFLEPTNGSAIHASLSEIVYIISNLVSINSSSNAGLNRSANITLYGITYTDPKPQYSYDGVTFTDCTATTDPACTELSFSGTTFVFNVTHFTTFRAAEAYVAPVVSGSSGGGGGGTPTVSFWNMTYVFTDEQFKNGYTKELSVKNRIQVRINNSYHSIGVVELTSTAKINVSSIPQQAIFSTGDTKKFDVTEDGYYDIAITLNGIANNKANVTILSIFEPTTREAQTEEDQSIGTDAGLQKEKKNLTWLWILLAVIAASVLAFFGYKKFWGKIIKKFRKR